MGTPFFANACISRAQRSQRGSVGFTGSSIITASSHVTLRGAVGMNAAPSPDERYQAIPHPAQIFRIARQIACKKSLLIEKTPNECRHHKGEDEQSPPRGECERDAHEHDEAAQVH